jgi:GNAT superfamily N-acetyltransferase
MCFDLTAELSDSILAAMENQNVAFVVDAQTGTLVEADYKKTVDEKHFYSLPDWNSQAGFSLRERFVSELHTPLVREELQTVLHSGRGVFRNFKNVIKEYPEVERKWHLFKNYEMRICINDWYNALRETWGLEKLDQEPEDIEDLVLKDFVFRKYDSGKDRESVLRQADALTEDMNNDWPEGIGYVFLDLWKHQFCYGLSGSEIGFICSTPSGDFTGCIVFTPCMPCPKKAAVLTGFFVLRNFRGLGIGKELFSLCLNSLHDQGVHWVIIANTIVPDTMIPLLDRSGFKRIGSGFFADLFEKETY